MQGLAAMVQVLLAGPQPCQLFDGALLFAVVLQQAAEDLNLFGHRFGFRPGLAVQQLQLCALFVQLPGAVRCPLLKPEQFGLALFQAIAHQHQLLQAFTMNVPSIADRCQVQAVLQLRGHVRQAFGHPLLLIQQPGDGQLAVSVGLLGVVLEFGRRADGLVQARQVALFFEGLTHQRGVAAVLALGLDQRGVGRLQSLLQLRLVLLPFVVLLMVLLDQHRQRAQLRREFGVSGKQVTLWRQVFQARQVQAFAGLCRP
ncbi:hypothetical protein D3C78_1108730 [compost metagenome]